MMKPIKKFSMLLTLAIVLCFPITTAQAASCPPHNYYHNGTFQVPTSGGSHIVTVNEWDATYGGYKNVNKNCSITNINTVYEYRCLCGSYFNESYLAYQTHSVNH